MHCSQWLLHRCHLPWLQVDKILLEVAGETLSQMAAAPRQQKQVRRLHGSATLSPGLQIRNAVRPPMPGLLCHLTADCGCRHCLVQAVQQAQPTEEEEDLQARLAAVKAG